MLKPATAQTAYNYCADPKNPAQKMVVGIVTKYIFENDPAFVWYKSGQTSYKPDAGILNAFESGKATIQFLVFGGSWCDDTQFILPKFFKLQELSGFPDSAITLLAVDRDKKTVGQLSAAFNITNVPTIIVMKEGKEIGRVVEYGKTGNWDKELADLIN